MSLLKERTDNYPDDIHAYDNDPRSPFFDDGGYEEVVESAFEDIESALVEDKDFDGIDRQDIDDQWDDECHLKVDSDIRWLLYSNPKILKRIGYTELQNRLDSLVTEKLTSVTEKYITLMERDL